MYKPLVIVSLICLLSSTFGLNAQQVVKYQRAQTPKRELRAAWVATVVNIDYPRSPSRDPIALKEQYRNMLDQLQALGMNTLIVQVRPAADALYPSRFAPWSAYLTGRQGAPPLENFDPLAFMIEETHSRSMEFHAWINPFRASMNMDTSSLFLTHPVFQHPDWLVAYGGKMYFNPGIPAVRDHLVDVVGELVDNYDLDGIHIDDYFYPYPHASGPFPDEQTFRFYGHASKDIGDWRRSNTNDLVQRLHTRIKTTRPLCQFGVSPFGVWRNQSQDPERGSATRAGATSYDDLYADVLHWIQQGWLDYVMPQLYWHIGYEPADHEILVKWWSQHARNTQLFIGHSAYKVGDNKELAWHDPAEIPRQIDLNRRNFTTLGSAFFSTKSLIGNPLRLKDSLQSYYAEPALWPEREGEGTMETLQPAMRKIKWNKKGGGVQLRWKPGQPANVRTQEAPHYYVVYRFNGNAAGSYDSPENIQHVTPLAIGNGKQEWIDTDTSVDEIYTYAVRAVNRNHKEGNAAVSASVLRKEKRTRRVKQVRARDPRPGKAPRTPKVRERKQKSSRSPRLFQP